MKVWGYIILDRQGKPMMGPYGDILLFKEFETAKQLCEQRNEEEKPRKVITSTYKIKKTGKVS